MVPPFRVIGFSSGVSDDMIGVLSVCTCIIPDFTRYCIPDAKSLSVILPSDQNLALFLSQEGIVFDFAP